MLAPIVPVTFRHQQTEFPTFALVDSGAAGAVISTTIAESLSIPWESIPASIGFTLSGQFRSHRFDRAEAEINGSTFSLALNIVEGISPYHCILGQADLFQKATITFEGFRKEFEIVFRRMN
ncbi:hypothetical protein A2875_03010 [Candidatus Gottesmanbacteria bacterium RIFCSPHIGHO2_01_FULL_46_14]|uniref:Peptidase A2 domain-containing protein n=2 Tax=Candidatus Gottesmaniibacteriota TaxID=1752720 RepID=A0A1F5ZRD5_9BACT|nr:MAG: hypothetical protein A2875_03010 [Candidatus Gottesmanbacteria bacterium RIFCSPHIGHO2_01_FULL_46_14]OGG30327.1 MAG: hypothetical protein A2971_01900 [Candidatus Gottesmanbacteria bacterium RIFCSPLOWO2_01_FULL_46_21]